MSQEYRDDAPAFSVFRRKFLIGGGLLLGGLAATPTVLSPAQAATDDPPPDPPQAPGPGPGQAPSPGEPATSADFPSRFLELSSLLIPHRLNRDVGLRLAAALRTRDPDFAAHVTALLDTAKRKKATIVEDFFADVADGPLKETALRIISGWYLGVIAEGPDAEVFAYELALMYQPTLDVMTIPTYAISGPNGWTSEAPPLSNMPTF